MYYKWQKSFADDLFGDEDVGMDDEIEFVDMIEDLKSYKSKNLCIFNDISSKWEELDFLYIPSETP